jgi:signal transduction histidine kinase
MEAPVLMTEDEKKKHLGKVNETAKNTIADLRESIWALKKQQVEIDELADKLKLYAQNQLSHQKGIRLEVTENIAIKSIISSAEALNIFRIFQEAINNSSKYAGGTKMILSVEATNDLVYKITIADDGKGFNASSVYNGHYGLENMQQRAKDIRAVLRIESSSNAGTSVTLTRSH